jgi:large subunit ribosomal protein L9
MQIILLERVEKLGQMGDVVRVKDGYARNFLLPQQKALRATKENIADFGTRKTQLEAENLDRRSEAEAVAAKMEGLGTILIRQASESGQLYGSVNARDVASAVTEAGFSVSRKQVQLGNPIKSLGLHDVSVRLHPEVAVSVSVNVARSTAEAEIQAKGIDPAADQTEAEQAVEVAEEYFETSELAEKAQAEADAASAPEDEATSSNTPESVGSNEELTEKTGESGSTTES